MPIVEKDPWRDQYFEGVACPENLIIPTDDMTAWKLFPAHRWVYNKLDICETQGIEAAPHGIDPPSFPVFAKPIYNMHGMGIGSHRIDSQAELDAEVQPGTMWMRLLEGEHVSTDVAVTDGEPRWWRHTIGHAVGGGMFDYWTVLAEHRQAIEDYCGAWLRKNLKGYSGCVNFETIDARIIECHLRFADQWPDLYGAGWLDAMVRLYQAGVWNFADRDRRNGYSVVLFGAHGLRYRHPDPALAAEIKTLAGVSSVQVTFHEGVAAEAHAMPPGGFRLAIVNGTDLEVAKRARERLAIAFWSTPSLRTDTSSAA